MYKFLPDDGHVHQYTDGQCSWCGAPTEPDDWWGDATGDRSHLVKTDNSLVHEGHSEGLHEGRPSLTVDERIAAGENVEDTSNEEIAAEIVNDEAIDDLSGSVAEAAPGTVTTLTVDMAEMMKRARIFHVKQLVADSPAGYETRPQTIMAFAIRPTEDLEIERFAGEAQRVLEWAKTLTITDGTSAKAVAGDLRSIAHLRRGVMERSKELLSPIMGVVADMKRDLALVTDPLAEADKIGRQKVTDWDALERQIQRDAEEATRKIAEAAGLARKVTDAGGEAPDLSAIQPVDIPEDRGPIRPDSGGTVSMIDHWSAEVTDKTLIPSEYMEPNMQMLNLAARQRKGSDPIPGIKWVNNPTPSVR